MLRALEPPIEWFGFGSCFLIGVDLDRIRRTSPSSSSLRILVLGTHVLAFFILVGLGFTGDRPAVL